MFLLSHYFYAVPSRLVLRNVRIAISGSHCQCFRPWVWFTDSGHPDFNYHWPEMICLIIQGCVTRYNREVYLCTVSWHVTCVDGVGCWIWGNTMFSRNKKGTKIYIASLSGSTTIVHVHYVRTSATIDDTEYSSYAYTILRLYTLHLI